MRVTRSIPSPGTPLGAGRARSCRSLLGGANAFPLFWEAPGAIASSFVRGDKRTKAKKKNPNHNAPMQKRLGVQV